MNPLIALLVFYLLCHAELVNQCSQKSFLILVHLILRHTVHSAQHTPTVALFRKNGCYVRSCCYFETPNRKFFTYSATLDTREKKDVDQVSALEQYTLWQRGSSNDNSSVVKKIVVNHFRRKDASPTREGVFFCPESPETRLLRYGTHRSSSGMD